MRTWNLITTVLVAGLIAGATAACGDGRATAPRAAAPPAAAPPAAAPPAAVAAPASPSPSPPAGASASTPAPSSASRRGNSAKPSGSGDPRSGTQYAILKSSRLSTRQITYDLIEWFDGEQAVKACAEDGEKPADNDYCTGYYVRNNNSKLRTLTVDPGAPIRMLVDGEMTSVDLRTFLGAVGNGNVIRFDVDAARIVAIEHVYLP